MEDIAYFSMNTITPLGYTEVRAANNAVRVLTVLELLAGVLWTVVVFGAVLTNLTEGHIRRIVHESQLARDQQRVVDTSVQYLEPESGTK